MSIRSCFAAACFVFATFTVAAQTDPRLEALVAEALATAPEIAATEADIEAAQRRVIPARTLADPFVSMSYQNDGRALSFGEAEGSFIGFMATQMVPWPGKLRAAGDIAASEVRELERGTLGRAALTLEARVRNAWYDLVLARAIDRIIEDRRNAATQIEASVRERYANGLAVQQDVLRAQVELTRLDELTAMQAATIASRTAELNRLVDAPLDRVIETPATLPEDSSVPLLAELPSPEIAAAEQGIESAQLRAELAKKNFLPDFNVSAGSMSRGSFEMGPMWQVGVGVSIPLWIERRQQNQLAEAQAVVRGRTSEHETLRRELELRTHERTAQLEAALRIATLYREKILPLDELSLESALASYQAGKVPFLSVLDALNTLYGDRSIYAERLADSAKWRVAIREASLGGQSGKQKAENRSGTGAMSSSGSMGSMR